MGGIEDYIKWRGDLTFEQSAFNEVDNAGLVADCLCGFWGYHTGGRQ